MTTEVDKTVLINRAEIDLQRRQESVMSQRNALAKDLQELEHLIRHNLFTDLEDPDYTASRMRRELQRIDRELRQIRRALDRQDKLARECGVTIRRLSAPISPAAGISRLQRAVLRLEAR